MHLLFILILLLGVGFWLWRAGATGGLSAGPSVRSEARQDISRTLEPLYISDGKLFSYSGGDKSNLIESKYVEDMQAREEKGKKLAAWKEGTTWDTSFAQMRGMGERHDEANIQFSSVTRSGDSKLLYFLKGAGFGGLFEYCLKTKKELRLMHRQNLDYRDLSRPNANEQVLLCAMQSGGNANIGLIEPHGNTYQELTGGDTIDTAPSWVWDKPNQMVYQSQGLARDPEGYIKGVGPAEIILFDTQSGDLSTIFADESSDYLTPQVSQSGSLYFIRRPYENAGYAPSSMVADALLFPFRLLRAVFHYLNFFSMMYSRKPLTSAGGPKASLDVKEVVLKGRRINTQKALRQNTGLNGTPSLVPASWVLVRCDKQGQQEVLATHVASYSIGDDDNIVYSNGCSVFYITPEGEHKKVLQEKLIDDVLI